MPADLASDNDRFPYFEPDQQIVLERLKRDIAAEFELCGFVPLETPCVEPKAVLDIDASLDEQTYALIRAPGERKVREAIKRAGEFLGSEVVPDFIDDYAEVAAVGIAPGDRVEAKILKIVAYLEKLSETGLALHSDLTLPLAHFVAENESVAPDKRLVFPFRRYQIQKVWRASTLVAPLRREIEEFYQCDIDVIGRGRLALLTDAEIPGVIYRVFRNMQIGKFVISIGNSQVSNAYLRHRGIGRSHGDGTPDQRSALQDAGKIINQRRAKGTRWAVEQLAEVSGISSEDAWKTIAFLDEPYVSSAHTCERLTSLGDDRLSEAAHELCKVVDDIKLFGVPDDYVWINPCMSRGLGYYTGTTYETHLVDHPGIGSICHGGRYDDLTTKFHTKERYPGVGISINLTPLFKRLLAAELVRVGRATTASVLVLTDYTDRAQISESISLAQSLRRVGINTEIFLENEAIQEQIRYANLKGFAVAIIVPSASSGEVDVKIKNLVAGGLVSCPRADVVTTAKDLLKTLAGARGAASR